MRGREAGGREGRVESVVLIFRAVETGLVITLSLGLLCNCGSSAAISLVFVSLLIYVDVVQKNHVTAMLK